MNKKSGLLMLFLTVSCNLFSAPRTVDIAKELADASFIGLVEIQEYYDDNDMILNNFKEDSAKLIHKIKLRILPSDSIFYVSTNKKIKYASYGYIRDPENKGYTGYWPLKGDIVLIITDSLNDVSLFGNKLGNQFLVWSPYLTGSIALFRFKAQTEFTCYDCADYFEIPPPILQRMGCLDKCLFPTKSIPAKFSRFVTGNTQPNFESTPKSRRY